MEEENKVEETEVVEPTDSVEEVGASDETVEEEFIEAVGDTEDVYNEVESESEEE